MDDSQIGFATGKVRERPKLEGGKAFVMNTEFEPAGDQPNAIAELSAGVLSGERDQVCLLYTSPSPRDLSTSRMPSSA